jgi:hypothetical protein
MTPQQIEAMNLALEALESAVRYHGMMLMSDPPQDAWKYHGVENKAGKAITAIEEALAEHAMREVQRLGQEIEQKIGCVNHDCDQCKAQPEQEPVAWHTNSPSDPEICNEQSAQACGPVYCGDSGGYCNKCPKQKIIQAVKPCKGMNCGCTDGRSHSLECLAELAAALGIQENT